MTRKTAKSDNATPTADRSASGIDPAARAANMLQLRRAKGQIDASNE
jgi:hypothetical protein